MWMQNLMECSSSVPKDLLYLELALFPIRFIIQTRRLLYFHHILQQKKDSVLHRFFMAQLSHPTAKDWVSQVLEELEDLSINLEIEEIKVMKRVFFKKIVKEAVKQKAFSYLLKKKEGRKSENAKGRNIKYEEFAMAEYLCPGDEVLSIEDKRWLFKCRVEDVDVKGNHR